VPNRLGRLLGLHSYRGRYLLLGIVFSAALSGAAYVGQSLVQETTERNTHRMAQTSRLLTALNDTSRQLGSLKGNLLNFGIDPTRSDSNELTQSKNRLHASTERLASMLVPMESASLDELWEVLLQDSQELSQHVSEFLNIRLSADAWLPANRPMREILVPLNMEMRTRIQHLDAMLAETPSSLAARLHLQKLRSRWSSLIGELRLIVANRFGVFDTDSGAAISARIANMEHFAAEVRRLLETLPTQLQAFDDLLLGEHAELERIFDAWMTTSLQVREMLGRKDWRRDTHYLRHDVEPVIERMQQRIGAMRLQIQIEAQKLLSQSNDNSAILARAITMVAAGMILLFLLGYAAFEHWMLRPIRHISGQLKREALGQSMEEGLHAPVSETRELIEAFDEMHRQVQARQRRLDHMAHHDPLTGLPNRTLFREQLNASLKTLDGEHNLALLFLDLDRFKNINDSHGHLVGDKLLVQVAQRLRSVFRAEDTVARLSGDEFAVLLHRFNGRAELERLAEKVVKTFKPPFEIDGNVYHSSASIGLTFAQRESSTADGLIHQADAAMYHAKAGGRSGYRYFDQSMVDQSSAQLELETALHTAIERNQLELFLQPIFNLQNGALHAHECLLRWRHPDRGLLSPDDFLNTLKDIGLLRRITDMMLDLLGEKGTTNNQKISINLPAKLLLNADFTSSLTARLQGHTLNPSHLIVEITEDSISRDLSKAARALQQLRQQGVRIALDDFGVGQSSLGHLRSFSFDFIKIDRSFVQDIGSDNQAADFVHAIMRLAQSLDIEVVAEGIETERQHRLLLEQGCHYGQGYLLGAPELMADLPKVQQQQS